MDRTNSSVPAALPAPGGAAPGWAARLLGEDAIDFWGSRLSASWSLRRPLARVVGRARASVNATTLWLRPNRHWTGCRPGQHVNLTAEVDGVQVTRSYSPCAVRANGDIAVTVKVVAGGRLSRHLVEHARPGDVVGIGPGFGDLALPLPATGPLLLLAAGSGITPIMALLRELVASGKPRVTALMYWSRRRDERCFTDELRALSARHPWLSVRFLLTGEAPAGQDEAQGRLEIGQLQAEVGDLCGCDVLACGPAGFVERARAATSGVVRSFQSEAFTPPPRIAIDTGVATVTLRASGRQLQVRRGTSLLEALEAAGMKPAHGCRMGICNSCSCGKASGTTRNLATGDASFEPISALKLCINAAAGDLVLDL